MFIRNNCPICGNKEAKHLIRMGKEYLMSGDSGWKHDPIVMDLAGFDFNNHLKNSCSYYECLSCGTFYLKEVMQMEEAFQKYFTQYTSQESGLTRRKLPSDIRVYLDRTDISMKMISLAIENNPQDEIKVLDYGCGGGIDLSILKAFRINCVIGYNVFDYNFDLIKKHMQKDIILVNNKKDLLKYAPFDAIRCNGVLEHVYNPGEIIDHIHSLLKENGVAYFSAPSRTRKSMLYDKKNAENGVKVKSFHPGHLNIWNRNKLSLPKYIKTYGFKIIPARNMIKVYNDITTLKGFFTYLIEYNKQLVKIIIDLLLLKLNRYKASSFFAVKIDK